jgi:predicted ATPase
VLPVAPLLLPGVEDQFDVLLDNAAVQLFVERARARVPQFKLTPETGASVAEICRGLDGILLAIELAAIRLTTMTVVDIANRVSEHLDLLTGGGHGVLARHRTLRASLDWSHALLQEPERRLLRRLAIFGQGFTLEAAQAVCATEDLPTTQIPVVLERLVAQSLVETRERDGTVRYGLFGTVGAYGLALLGQVSEESSLRERHLQWCLGLADHRGCGGMPGGSGAEVRM